MACTGLLTYYKNHKKKSCLGTISLSNAIVTVSSTDSARFVVDTDYGVFYLRTQSENQAEQREEWIKTIQLSQVGSSKALPFCYASTATLSKTELFLAVCRRSSTRST
eukprot:SAG22_NODE_2076_length_3044_cov_9.837691_2_plen_108_part_00